MGFFNTKKVHSVNATALRVIDKDSQIPNSILTGVVTSLYQNDEQLVENVLESLITGIGSRAHRMYAYGKKHYTYGVPTGTKITSDTGAVAVETAIEKYVDPAATVEYHYFAPLNNLHVGWMALVDTYGYKSSTNRLDVLTAQKGSPVYLKDMVVVLSQTSADQAGVAGVEQWGVPPTAGVTPERLAALTSTPVHSPYSVDALATQDYVKVSYVWESTSNVVVDGITVARKVLNTGTLNIPFPELEADREDDDYFQVMYLLNGNYGYWLYKHGAGTYPELDALFTVDVPAAGSFFPFAYFRYGQQSMAANVQSDAYKTSEKLVKYLGIEYADMIASIHENPDIDAVEQAIMMMGVPAKTTNQVERRYLYEFFDRIVAENGETESSRIRNNGRRTMNRASRVANALPPKVNYTIQDKRFKMSLGCDSLTRTKKAGKVAKVGEYSSAWISVGVSVLETVTDSEGNMVLDMDTGKAIKVTKVYQVPTHVYQKQLSAAVYEEIAITGMRSSYDIWGGMTTIGIEGTDTNELLLVPLDYSITRKYSLPVREELYARSLHFIFTSHTITKVKWYQKSAFKIIFIVVAVVLAIITQGASIKATIALWSAMTAVQLAYALLIVLIKYVIVTLVVKLFVKLVGAKAAFIVALITLVAAAYGVIDAGSVQGAPWAKDLLMLSSNLATEVGKSVQDSFKGLQNEYSAFGTYADAKTAELDKANKLLETSNVLSPFLIFGETPNDFYNRTVHSGNIGINSIDAISSYVTTALTLPELTDTMGYN